MNAEESDRDDRALRIRTTRTPVLRAPRRRRVRPRRCRGALLYAGGAEPASLGATARGPVTHCSVARAGQGQLMIGAASTLVPRGIRVNGIRIGTIWSLCAGRAFDETARAACATTVTPATEGTVWDIEDDMVLLTPPCAGQITGQILAVDGGGPVGVPPGYSSRMRANGGLG